MKKLNLLMIGAVLFSLALVGSQQALADCGKMVIIYYQWPSPPPPPPQPPQRWWCGDRYQPRAPQSSRSFRNTRVGEVLQRADNGSMNLNLLGDNNQVYAVNQPKPAGRDRRPPRGFTPMSDRQFDDSSYGEWARSQGQGTDGSDGGGVTPGSPDDTGFAMGPDDSFIEPNQQAVLAWNGTEEILILSTNEQSTLPQGTAMLSVLPLPGEPVSVERANIKSFVTAKAIMQEKLDDESDDFSLGEVLSTKIGSHNIFVWKIESKDDFKGKVQSYIAKTYNNEAAAIITPNTLKVIDQYLADGFEYFAFDLTIVEDGLSTKEAIAYRFKSKYAYFPLRISQVGGTGRTAVDLVVLTTLGDKQLTFTNQSGIRGGDPDLATFFAKKPFTSKDLGDIDASLPQLFGAQPVYGRLINFSKDEIDGFQKDFQAVAVPPRR